MSKLFVLFLGLAILVCGAGGAFAQSRYLEDGQNGFAVSGAVGSGEDYTSFGAGFDYSISGRYDIGVGISRASYDEDEFGPDFSSTEITPFFAIALVRPSETSPVGFELGASYGFASISGDVLDYNELEMSANATSLGGNVYFFVDSSPTLRIIPSLTLAYNMGKSKIEDSFGNSVETDVDGIAIGGAVSFQINKKVWIVPRITHFDESTSWSVRVGLTMPSG